MRSSEGAKIIVFLSAFVTVSELFSSVYQRLLISS